MRINRGHPVTGKHGPLQETHAQFTRAGTQCWACSAWRFSCHACRGLSDAPAGMVFASRYVSHQDVLASLGLAPYEYRPMVAAWCKEPTKQWSRAALDAMKQLGWEASA